MNLPTNFPPTPLPLYSFVMLGNFSFLDWQKLTTSFSFFFFCFVFRACSCVYMCACVCVYAGVLCCHFQFLQNYRQYEIMHNKKQWLPVVAILASSIADADSHKNGSKYEHARTHKHTHRHIHMYACLAGTPLTTSSSVYCCAMKIRNEKFIRRIKRSAIESHLCYLFLIHDTTPPPPAPFATPSLYCKWAFVYVFYAPTNCHRYICCVQHCV